MRWLLRRWWFWAGTGFILVAILAGYLVIPVSEGRISQANCDRIQLGMTFEEVKSLLGEHCLAWPGTLWVPNVVTWYDDLDDYFYGNHIDVTFKAGWHDDVLRKEFHRTELPFHVRLKHRIERRIRALWP